MPIYVLKYHTIFEYALPILALLLVSVVCFFLVRNKLKKTNKDQANIDTSMNDDFQKEEYFGI